MGKVFRARDTFAEDGWVVTQGYANNPAYYQQFNILFHEGVDLAKVGDRVPVRSVCDGVVVQDFDNPAGRNYGISATIWDDKQGCAWMHNHMIENLVSVGDRVKAGQIIGYEGSTGNSTGKHDHLNFMITNPDGSRKYNTKEQNWGLLDPKYPRDLGAPVNLPNVEEYSVEWYQGEDVTNSDNNSMIDPMVQKKGSRYDEIAIDDLGEGTDTNKITDARHEQMRVNFKDRKIGNGQLDVVIKYLALTVKDKAQAAQMIINSIGGYKSKVTEANNNLTAAQSELANKTEQVDRLKGQLLIEQEAKSGLQDALKKATEGQGSAIDVLNQQIAGLQSENDQLGREKGELINEIGSLKQVIETDRATIDQLKRQGADGLSVIDLLMLAVKKLSPL